MVLLSALRPLDTLLSEIPLPGAEEFDASLAFILAPDPVFDVTSRYEHLARQPVIANWIDDSDYPRLRPLPRFAKLRRWFARPRKRLLAGLVEGHEKFFSTYEEMADASPLSVLFAGGAQRYPPIFAAQKCVSFDNFTGAADEAQQRLGRHAFAATRFADDANGLLVANGKTDTIHGL